MNFSRLKLTQPFPPSPERTVIRTSSIKPIDWLERGRGANEV
jgi:hypothetical protein